MKDNPLLKLEAFGQSIWMDFIRRGTISSGELKQLIEEDGVSGMTSNPSIFEKAIAGSHDYDDAIRKLALEGESVDQIYAALTVEGIQGSADLFRPIYDRLDGSDGFVSLEVSPYLARDTDKTIADARRLWVSLARPNVMIKVPATLDGLPAIQQLIGEGININITLLFGLSRYRQVAEAYIAGLETLAAKGKPLKSVASVASFFLSRIDVLLDPMLEKTMAINKSKADLAATFHGEVAILSAKAAYQIYQEIFDSERFGKLRAQGARTQRLLWASTSTKNPAWMPRCTPTLGSRALSKIISFRSRSTSKSSQKPSNASARNGRQRCKSWILMAPSAISSKVFCPRTIFFHSSSSGSLIPRSRGSSGKRRRAAMKIS